MPYAARPSPYSAKQSRFYEFIYENFCLYRAMKFPYRGMNCLIRDTHHLMWWMIALYGQSVPLYGQFIAKIYAIFRRKFYHKRMDPPIGGVDCPISAIDILYRRVIRLIGQSITLKGLSIQKFSNHPNRAIIVRLLPYTGHTQNESFCSEKG